MKVSNNNPNINNFPKRNTNTTNNNKKNMPMENNSIDNNILNKATYNKPKLVSTFKLREEREQTYSQLKQLIIDLLKGQGYRLGQIKNPSLIEVPEYDFDVQDYATLLGPEGELGAEKTSDRIVEFAIAISGGDKTKFDTLKEAIIKGFKEAEQLLGELPDISRKTYDLVMEKLDKWLNETE